MERPVVSAEDLFCFVLLNLTQIKVESCRPMGVKLRVRVGEQEELSLCIIHVTQCRWINNVLNLGASSI